MGLFQNKKKPAANQTFEEEQHFFDENFREELRNHGRLYFDKVIKENGALFKQELDATIAQVNTELKDHVINQLDSTIAQVNAALKEHVTKQLEDQFSQYSKALKEAQDEAMQSLTKSIESLQEQHAQLGAKLEKSVDYQEAMLTNVFEKNKTQITAMSDAQATALKSLDTSVQAVQKQYEQLDELLHKSIADQQAVLTKTFEDNMARIVEHYLLGAVGDQYDLKAQLPSIIQQMEANKQAIVDDMKL